MYIILENIKQYILNTENVQRKIDSLLVELQEKTGVSNEELEELKKILDLANLSEDLD